jgi:hypothetical protein
MPNYPPWKDMSDAQKFEFLHEWLERVSLAVQTLQGATQGLHERLRVVEAANAQRPNPES